MRHQGIETKNGTVNGALGRASALAVILARAGSRGVPGKNVAPVGGRPCIAWSIDAAMHSASVSRVVVSTDDETAKRISREMGADAIDRPTSLAGDRTPVDDALRHAVEQFDRGQPGAAAGSGPVVMLYANVPVRPHDLIDRAVELLVQSGADSVQSYAPVGKHHPWWTCRLNPETGEVRPWEGDALFHNTFRRQDLPPAHLPDGGVTVVTRDALFGRLSRVQPGPHAFLGRASHRRGIVVPEGSVIDIDSRIDLIVADAVLRSTRESLV